MRKSKLPETPVASNGRTRSPRKPAAPVSTEPAPVEPTTLPDPFDPEAFRLKGDFASEIGVKKALLTIPVRKPDKAWFVRTHPDPAYRVLTAVVELKEDREIYAVAESLQEALATETTFGPRWLFTSINRQGVVFLWPVKPPTSDGRSDHWNRSALEAADLAAKGWVRVQANLSLGAYDVQQATGNIPEPQFPDMSFRDMLYIAFKGNYIDSIDHPVIRRLRGEV
jgi:hypothetical protein